VKRTVVALAAGICLASRVAIAQAPPEQSSASGCGAEAVERVARSVVRIEGADGGWSAGFVFLSPTQVVTARHVILNRRIPAMRVVFADGTASGFSVVAWSKRDDLAVLRLVLISTLSDGEASRLTDGMPTGGSDAIATVGDLSFAG
jgi:S1-C subfamily serine protease